MKYAITHCYTDKNKGDAAIIIATTQLIRSIDPAASINFYSTYGPRDERLVSDHEIISPYADNVYPGLFYQPEPLPFFSHDSLRGISFLIILAKALLLLVTAKPLFLRWFMTKREVEGITEFLTSDIVISKGGSYLTTQNTSVRQTLSLVTMLYPFIFARRHKKKIVIFSQSLGPVEGEFNNWLFSKSLERVEQIYLRESLCLKEYPAVRSLCEKVDTKVIPDSAFYLEDDHRVNLPIEIDKDCFNVGYTLVDHAFKYVSSMLERQEKRENYKKSIIDSMIHLMEARTAIIHIFPQVLVGNSHYGHNDLRICREVAEHFSGGKYSGRVRFYEADYTPSELRRMYGEMDLFIGTRLHSVIFALSMCIPSLNISYHGTKSRGILSEVADFDKYVIDIDFITSEELVNRVDDLFTYRSEVEDKLSRSMTSIRSDLNKAMREVCGMAGCRV